MAWTESETIDERCSANASFKEAVELLQAAFASEDEEQVKEAKTFCELETKQQLKLVLEGLRNGHRYCLFCGCQYGDDAELGVLSGTDGGRNITIDTSGKRSISHIFDTHKLISLSICKRASTSSVLFDMFVALRKEVMIHA